MGVYMHDPITDKLVHGNITFLSITHDTFKELCLALIYVKREQNSIGASDTSALKIAGEYAQFLIRRIILSARLFSDYWIFRRMFHVAWYSIFDENTYWYVYQSTLEYNRIHKVAP